MRDRALEAGSAAHYEDPAYYTKTYKNRTDDVRYYTDLAVESGGPILEYGCGNGRIAIPIARRGVDIGRNSQSERDAPTGEVEMDGVADLEHGAGFGRCGAPAADGAHARYHLPGGERLGDVVVGTRLEATDPIGLVVAGGQEQYGDGGAGPQALHHREPVDARQADVDDREVGTVLVDELEPAFAVRGQEDPEAGVTEVEIEQIGDVGVVLDHDQRREDSRFRHGCHRAMTRRPPVVWAARAPVDPAGAARRVRRPAGDGSPPRCSS